jgi:hypothetical protein
MPLLQHQPHDELRTTSCPSCGWVNQVGATACLGCGQPLGVAVTAPGPDATSPPPTLPPPGAATEPALHPARSGGRWLWFGLAAAVVLGAAVLLFWLWYRPAFVVRSVEASDLVISAEPVQVEVQLVNEGRAGGEQELTVLVDGSPSASASAEVAAGAEETVTFTLDGFAPGTYELSLAEQEAPTIVVSAISLPQLAVNDAVLVGEEVIVEVSLMNDSAVPIGQQLEVLIDDGPAAGETVDLEPGDEQTVTFGFADLPAGTYELGVALAGWQGPASAVWVFDAPQLSIPVSVASGESLQVRAQLANDGQLAVEQEVRVVVDGDAAAAQTVEVGAGSESTVTFPVGGLTAGSHQVAIGIADWTSPPNDVWVFEPPELDLPGEVIQGEDLVIEVTLANDGTIDVEQELAVHLDGVPAATAPVALGAGSEDSVTLTVGDLSAGTHEVALALGPWQSEPAILQVLTPPSFEIDALEVSPNPMDVNDSPTVTVLAAVSNAGQAGGTYNLQVQLDGATVEERPVDVAGGADVQETLEIRVTSPGSHAISVGERSVELEAYRLQRPSNGTVITNQLAGGSNRLRITNNNQQDVLVVLAEPGSSRTALLSVYVRAGSSHTVRGIRSGTYATYYSFGSDWCTHNKAFTRSTSYGRFEGTDTYTATSTTYTQFDVEFGITEGPGSATNAVNESDFPRG